MEIDLHAGKRVLYKDANGGGWQVGEIALEPALVNNKGVWFSIIPNDKVEDDVRSLAEINDIFLDAQPVEDWMKQYHNLMTKEEYIAFIESDDFERAIEQAWVSDGEYYYYPVSKYSATWILKQPFDYIVRRE